MSKYICSFCGDWFSNEGFAKRHEKTHLAVNEPYHHTYKMTRKDRLKRHFSDPFMFNVLIKTIGFSMMFLTVCNHFNIDFNIFEFSLIGGGAGLVMARFDL